MIAHIICNISYSRTYIGIHLEYCGQSGVILICNNIQYIVTYTIHCSLRVLFSVCEGGGGTSAKHIYINMSGERPNAEREKLICQAWRKSRLLLDYS